MKYNEFLKYYFCLHRSNYFAYLEYNSHYSILHILMNVKKILINEV